LGLIALIAADLVIASFASLAAPSPASCFGARTWGSRKACSRRWSPITAGALRGTAFGVFHLVSGVALLARACLPGGYGASTARRRPSMPGRHHATALADW